MYQVLDLTDIPEDCPVFHMASYYSGLPCEGIPSADENPVPIWDDFNPIKIKKILPWTMVMQREGASPEGHLIKLEGERIVEATGVNSMGKTLAEAFDPKMAKSKWEEMEMVAQERRPSFTLSPVPRPERAFINLYRGCFPFCDKTGKITRLVLIVAPVEDKVY